MRSFCEQMAKWNRWQLWIGVAVWLGLGGLLAGDGFAQDTGAKPNIIFFFSDQQRWDTLGCYGQKLPLTPNLDRMAAEGVRFEFAFTCQPVCGPARSCLQTGKYATQTGCFRNNIGLPTDEKTIAHWLSDGGYEVGYLGKWHLASTGLGDVKVNLRM
jgi:arylsulfatase A-like enzyme